MRGKAPGRHHHEGRKKPVLNIFNETRPANQNLFSPAFAQGRVEKKTDPISFHDQTFPTRWAGGKVTLTPLSVTLMSWGGPPPTTMMGLKCQCQNHTASQKLSVPQASSIHTHSLHDCCFGAILMYYLEYHLIFFFKWTHSVKFEPPTKQYCLWKHGFDVLVLHIFL